MTKRADWMRLIAGSKGDDHLMGTAGKDVIVGRQGDDWINGGAGNDILIGDGGSAGKHWGWHHIHWWKPQGRGDDYLDGGAGSDRILAGGGDDVANFTLSENARAHDVYDGGKGFDTLQLTLTQAELQLASVQEDIAAFESFLARRANANCDDGKTFEFKSFNLDVRNFEALEIQPVGGNTAPVAQTDSYSLDEDTALLVAGPGVAGNDTDAEGSALSVALVAGPAHGALVLNADGSFSYTPEAEFNGSDSFSYKANDGTLDSNVVSVALMVAPVNDAPVAADDDVATDEDLPVNGNVLNNDADADGDALTAALVAGPAHGALVLNADGSFSYTPEAEFNGSDSFSYKANDGTLDSNVVSVALMVAPVNDAPVAIDDVIPEHAIAAGPIRVAVIGGNSGGNVAAAAQLGDSTAFSFDADAIRGTAFTTQAQWAALLENYDTVVLGDSGFGTDYGATPLFPALRDFVDAGGGVVTTGWFAYIFPSLSAAARADADYVTPIALQPYQYARNGSTITILDTAHPIANGVASYRVNALAHELAGGVDAGATVLASGVTSGGTSLPALVVDEVGQGLTAYFGSLQMASASYSPDRIAGGTVDQIFERVVAWAAGARDVIASTDEDTPLAIDAATLLANDRDIENDALGIGAVSATSALGGAVSIDAGGSIVYDPTMALQYLRPGQVVTDSFDYAVFDGNGGTDIGTVSLTVAGRADTVPLL